MTMQLDALDLKYRLSWQDKNIIKKLPITVSLLSKSEFTDTEKRFIQVFNEEALHIQDQPSQSFQLMCAHMVALYEALQVKNFAKQEILDILTTALVKSAGGNFIKWITRISLWTTRNKRKLIEKYALKSKAIYGNFLEITEEYEEQKFVSIVTSCGIFDFFSKRGCPELTTVFCAWDKLWADEINRQRCGVRFERPTIISLNDNSCRFEFSFDKKPD